MTAKAYPISVIGLCFFLLACSSPSPKYMGIKANEQTVSGVRFDVYQLHNNAQVIRLSGRLPGGYSSIKLAAITAIEQATNCKVEIATVEGDTEVINAVLSC